MGRPTIYWMRRDFRLADNPALSAAEGPVLPVFIRDEAVQMLGAAPKFRLGKAISSFSGQVAQAGGQLVLRSGPALEVLQQLIAETGAQRVIWNRLYDPAAIERDTKIKAVLTSQGIKVQSFNAHLLLDPWQVMTGQGGPYRVFSPYWRALQQQVIPAPLPRATTIWAKDLTESESLTDWRMAEEMNSGAAVVAKHLLLGEDAAQARLSEFLDGPIANYDRDRDRLDRPGCSRFSEPLSYGEISPRQIWHLTSLTWQGQKGAASFLRQLAWRDFAYHLLYHTPEIATRNWRPDWDGFDWQGPSAASTAWQRGQTGIDGIDAAMRELYVTGHMHNRARMLVASYLTKHLMTDWRIGQRWFEETLVDFDPASNAMGWQWVAGSGPDAAPYFRVFNPDLQMEKFDSKGHYRQHWLSGEGAKAFHAAHPQSWGSDRPREPIVDLPTGRARALAAYHGFRSETTP